MPAGPLAIVAGAGRFPLEVAEAATANGYHVRLVGIAGSADPEIERFPHVWVKLGELGKLYKQLHAWECQDLVIVGAVTRPHMSEIKFDIGALSSLPDLTRLLKGGDDGVLGGIVSFLEARGYRVHGILDVAPDLAAREGRLGAVPVDASAERLITYGADLLTALAPFDVGQGAVVMDGRAIAVEGIEGTDAMLERVAALRASGRLRVKGRIGVLVKAPKRGQNMKVDLPTIGVRTIEKALEAQLAGIAIAAQGVLIADRASTVRAADEGGLFLYGMPSKARGLDRS
ncbi:hypothetical protein GCM10007276_21920 [Agaricicola taiwanensis]|uniref:LpxI family protein n=1 Tax=Agaricicola taiwanensis TaxID=591372 RepID=A0A8J3DVB2_9RHOB|nr:UDP-2,3-diacylglucosamine diphosphatase LpxI [Agaricicola taiwanensis]GGE44409.1 hypothetical protein GCM10007276_21920 [Agaricicola taiwanensis]